jgi:hypothetical protein
MTDERFDAIENRLDRIEVIAENNTRNLDRVVTAIETLFLFAAKFRYPLAVKEDSRL